METILTVDGAALLCARNYKCARQAPTAVATMVTRLKVSALAPLQSSVVQQYVQLSMEKMDAQPAEQAPEVVQDRVSPVTVPSSLTTLLEQVSCELLHDEE